VIVEADPEEEDDRNHHEIKAQTDRHWRFEQIKS